jgi:aldehyde:ferredoxin oxidoreductase
VGDASLESKLFEAVTGARMSEEESYRLGDMLCTLERAIQAREGRSRDDDVLREICFTNRDAAKRQYHREDLERAKDGYYKLRGWDERGIPTAERLKTLKLNDVAADLARRGIIASEAGKA